MAYASHEEGLTLDVCLFSKPWKRSNGYQFIIISREVNWWRSPFYWSKIQLIGLLQSTTQKISIFFQHDKVLPNVLTKPYFIRGLFRKYRDWIYYAKTYIHKQVLSESPSKCAPLTVTYLAQRCFQSSKHFWNSYFGMAWSCCVEFCFMKPVFLILGKRKKSEGDMSGE